jgi:hypothetical protein
MVRANSIAARPAVKRGLHPALHKVLTFGLFFS